MDDLTFKVSFNKPAGRLFFEGEPYAGLQVKLEDDTVMFRPVTSIRGADCVPLAERPRGGHEVTIDGTRAEEILAALRTTGATTQRPFFLLFKAPKGWMTIQHFDKEGSPPKFEPHLRLWAPRDESDATQDAAMEETNHLPAAFVAQIRKAHRTITEHHGERRIGRPPREVREARETLAELEKLVGDVLPSMSPARSFDLRPLLEAHASLTTFLGTARIQAAQEVVEPEPTAPAPAAPRAADAPRRGRPPKVREAVREGRVETPPEAKDEPEEDEPATEAPVLETVEVREAVPAAREAGPVTAGGEDFEDKVRYEPDPEFAGRPRAGRQQPMGFMRGGPKHAGRVRR